MITTYNQIDKAGALVLEKVSQRHDCTPEEMVGPTKPDRIAVPRHMAALCACVLVRRRSRLRTRPGTLPAVPAGAASAQFGDH